MSKLYPNRKSLRLKGYDYSAPGFYFLTICAHNKQNLFGEIQNGELTPNQLGKIVVEEWIKSVDIRRELELYDWILMPNHFHGIIAIKSPEICRGDRLVAHSVMECEIQIPGDQPVAPTGPKSKTIGAFIAGFKAAVTTKINTLRHTPGAQVWQRNYYEHVIRNEPEFNRIKEYIQNNPMQWEEDCFFKKIYPSISGL
ncbi:MAG: transposase [Bacteroidetes bacterium]|nr:transposase [Bacteroidota bacterium]